MTEIFLPWSWNTEEHEALRLWLLQNNVLYAWIQTGAKVFVRLAYEDATAMKLRFGI